METALNITDAEFSRLSWPEQQRVLDEILRASCRIGGRTWGEAQRKRQPLEDRHAALRAIKDRQTAEWAANA